MGEVLQYKGTKGLIAINIILVMMVGQRRRWHPTPVLLPGKSHGRRSLVGCSPCQGSDMTERLHFHFSLSCIGEGNGKPLQCSCLENPRDGGAWWAAIYGVAQSWTRLKRLSSMMEGCFLKCCLNLMPVGDPVIFVAVKWACLQEEETWFRSLEKDIQLCSCCFLNCQEWRDERSQVTADLSAQRAQGLTHALWPHLSFQSSSNSLQES